MHILSSMLYPSQSFPTAEGVGSSHDLDRVWLPFPHVTAHALQLDHPAHPPFTLKMINNA